VAENKTKATEVSPDDFIAGLAHPVRKADASILRDLMAEITGEPPVMWGPTMIGFGREEYAYESGRRGVIFRIGFSPRSASQVLYGAKRGPNAETLLAGLGKYKLGKGCLYITRLADVDLEVLRALLADSWAAV
jgi:Domain of unknown function (DU1801)